MSRPLRIVYPGAFYHVTSRGNEQKDVFKSKRDREKFLEYLESATARYGAVIHVYCLMSNHYHLLVETPAGNLPQIMGHINGAYTTYYNIKRKRSGHLFQGRYKAILVEFDEYALELSRYIHLNPVRAGMVALPEEYRWSSYRNYIGQESGSTWLKLDTMLDYFGKKTKDAMKQYRSFVEDLLGQEYDNPFTNTFGAVVLGTAEFREMVSANHLSEKEVGRGIPGIRQFKANPELKEIVKAVATVMGEKEKLARQVGMYLCHKYSGKKLRDIGDLFGVGETAIAEARRLLTRKMEKDQQLCGEVEKVKAILGI